MNPFYGYLSSAQAQNNLPSGSMLLCSSVLCCVCSALRRNQPTPTYVCLSTIMRAITPPVTLLIDQWCDLFSLGWHKCSWTTTSTSPLLHVSHLTVFLLRSDGWKKSGWLRGEDLEAVCLNPNEESTKKQCGTYGRVTADLWVGLRSPLWEKYRWALSLVSGPQRLMAGRGLSLAPGVSGVETGLGWNGWEQQIMREICLRSNHWL